MAKTAKQVEQGIACQFTVLEPVLALERFQQENGTFDPYPVCEVNQKESREYVTSALKRGFTHIDSVGKRYAWHAQLLSVAAAEGKITALKADGTPAKIGDIAKRIIPPVKMGRDNMGRMLV